MSAHKTKNSLVKSRLTSRLVSKEYAWRAKHGTISPERAKELSAEEVRKREDRKLKRSLKRGFITYSMIDRLVRELEPVIQTNES